MIPVYHFFGLAGAPDVRDCGVSPDLEFLGHHELFPRVDNKPDASGWVDEDRIKRRLENVPTRTPLLVNIESGNDGHRWRTLVYKDKKPQFCEEGSDLRMQLYELLRNIAPGCPIIDYRQPDGWGGLVLKDHWYPVWQGYVEQMKPLLNDLDFVCPQFYFNIKKTDWPAGVDDALLWMRRHFDTLRSYVPLAKICPIVWPVWYDLWRVNHDPSCLMAAEDWRRIFGDVLRRANAVIVWGQLPWSDDAPWWTVTKELLAGNDVKAGE